MIYQIANLDFNIKQKIIGLIKNFRHELTVECVIQDKTPGKIFVDDTNSPSCCLIKTSECNILAGDFQNENFISEVGKQIDYFDTITCENESWEKVINKIHTNIGLRKYTRLYYVKRNPVSDHEVQSNEKIRFIYYKDLVKLDYKNNNIIKDWIILKNVEDYQNVCLATLIIKDDNIVSCSGLDCIIDDRVEIGIKTISQFRKNGYGLTATRSMINELYKNGIQEIGWHCVSTNVGSKRIAELCGFKEILNYSFFSPFPPIENISDLTNEQWVLLAKFFQEKGVASIDQYWQAARCWAKAGEISKIKECINQLLSANVEWFKPFLIENEEFKIFANDDEWKKYITNIL